MHQSTKISRQINDLVRIEAVPDPIIKETLRRLNRKVTDMSCNTIDFVTYCIGNLSRRLNMSAVEVYRRLKQSGILTGYIVPSYDVLHTFSKEYLMEDLTEYMREKGVLA